MSAVGEERTYNRTEECNIRLKEICYRRDCEYIVILANEESIPDQLSEEDSSADSLQTRHYLELAVMLSRRKRQGKQS
jgi:hypothetical protein